MPHGFESLKGPQYCLNLVKSLYGHKAALLLWFKHSSKAFKKLGLTQSAHNKCLWLGKNIMVVQYVDSCGISAPNQKIIDDFVQGLRDYGLCA